MTKISNKSPLLIVALVVLSTMFFCAILDFVAQSDKVDIFTLRQIIFSDCETEPKASSKVCVYIIRKIELTNVEYRVQIGYGDYQKNMSRVYILRQYKYPFEVGNAKDHFSKDNIQVIWSYDAGGVDSDYPPPPIVTILLSDGNSMTIGENYRDL
jgi:hypothetical protein